MPYLQRLEKEKVAGVLIRATYLRPHLQKEDSEGLDLTRIA
jgi:hypothetical protein